MNEWIDVQDRLPPDNVARGIRLASGEETIGSYHRNSDMWHIYREEEGWGEWTNAPGAVSHWAELPGEEEMQPMIPELDLDQLEADLYKAWQYLQQRNYGMAERLITISWRQVRQFRLSHDYSHLPSTRDRGLVPAAKRLLYHFLNRRINCGYECAWVYPYGWVPEADCPEHDTL